MSWIILPQSNEVSSLFDQFIEGPLRLVLSGTTLEVRIEGVATTAELRERAERLARDYVSQLGHNLGRPLRIVTEDEFAKTPPWAGGNLVVTAGPTPRRGLDLHRILRDARHDVTSYGWPLRSCYDYLQEARSSSRPSLPEMYKMIETMEETVGGEAPLIAQTELKDEIKFLKRIANEHSRDERHAPKDHAPPQPVTDAERDKANQYSDKILRKFEELCRATGRAGK